VWYVIQTRTGEESRVVTMIEGLNKQIGDVKCIVPLFEQVRRSATSYKICIRRMFPGYILAEADDPEAVAEALKIVPEFTRMLGTKEADEGILFLPIADEDVSFMNALLEDGMLRLSYLQLVKGRIDRVIGPLAAYAGNITHLDIQHRRAIVEKKIFGKHRKICFGLWVDGDPENAWIQEQVKSGKTGVIPQQSYDIGFREGDVVHGINGMYEENEMRVLRVDAVKRTLVVELELFGRKLPISVPADNVVKK